VDKTPPLPRRKVALATNTASQKAATNSQVFDNMPQNMPSFGQGSDKFLPSLNDLQDLQLGDVVADADAVSVSDALPMGTYEFEPPKERQEVGAMAAINKMLKSQRELLRQQNQRTTPDPKMIARYENEIVLLLQKKEGLKTAKKWGGII
jgi:hypothetical protein